MGSQDLLALLLRRYQYILGYQTEFLEYQIGRGTIVGTTGMSTIKEGDTRISLSLVMSELKYRYWDVLQTEGRQGGFGQDGGDTETRAGVVEELEIAGGSWEAMLLAALSQSYVLLAMHSGGAAGTWRHWKRRRRRRNFSKGGRGSTTIQRWWMQLRSIAHQNRCGYRGKDKRRGGSGEQTRTELEVQNSEGADTCQTEWKKQCGQACLLATSIQGVRANAAMAGGASRGYHWWSHNTWRSSRPKHTDFSRL